MSSFLWETHEKALFRGTWWGPFSGAKQSGNCQSVEHCKKYVFFRDVDGATPTHSPKSGCKCPHRWRNSFLNPSKKKSGIGMGFKGHRWRNSFYTIQICAIPPYIQAKMIGNVVNLVNNTLMSIYWSGSCAIYLLILK